MKYMLFSLLMLFASVIFSENVATLIQAEKDFSALSVQKGVNESFVTFFADNAVVLRPGPVNGKKWYQDRKPSTGQLSWEPLLSELSAAGDLGYNTGPWEFRENAEDKEPAGHGQFFSFWKKQPDGKWKVVIDHGHDNQKPDQKAEPVTIPAQKPARSKYPESELKDL
jgi:ketosteroid isomerase-like protein